MSFFSNSIIFNIITLLGFLLSIWVLLKKNPKKLTVYYQGSKPFISDFYNNIHSLILDGKTIQFEKEKGIIVTTIFLQNTGSKDFKISDFDNGINIFFPKEYKILKIKNYDYPKDINSKIKFTENTLDIEFKTLKKNEIIKFEILAELESSISLLKDITFKCRGAGIDDGKVQSIGSGNASFLMSQLSTFFVLIMLIFLCLSISIGIIKYPNYYDIKVDSSNYIRTGLLKYLSKDSILFYPIDDKDSIANKMVSKAFSNLIVKQHHRERPLFVWVVYFLFLLILVIMFYIQFRKFQFKEKLEKYF